MQNNSLNASRLSNCMKDILDQRMNDGSRLFASIAEPGPLKRAKKVIGKLDGVEITSFVGDHSSEFWLDFIYRSKKFSINNPNGEYWFFSEDPNCDEELLRELNDFINEKWT